MTKTIEKENTKKDKKNFFEFMTEFFGWIEIVISTTLLSGMLGFLIYLSKRNTLTLILGIAIATLGLIFGIIYATKIWKKRGTVDFISRVSASPELDNLEPPQ
jgi:ABC-type transport system involved in cytochrome c biogenesis permease subunit